MLFLLRSLSLNTSWHHQLPSPLSPFCHAFHAMKDWNSLKPWHKINLSSLEWLRPSATVMQRWETQSKLKRLGNLCCREGELVCIRQGGFYYHLSSHMWVASPRGSLFLFLEKESETWPWTQGRKIVGTETFGSTWERTFSLGLTMKPSRQKWTGCV